MEKQLSIIWITLIILSLSCDNKVHHPIDFFSKNTELVSKALNNSVFKWENKNTEHFDIHFIPSIWTQNRVDTIAVQLEYLYKKNIEILGDTDYAKRVDIFLVESKADVKEIVGQAVTASPLLPERACVFSNSRLATRIEILQHELMHVLSFDIWGIPNDFFMAEGLATSAYGASICGYQFDAISKYVYNMGYLPPVGKLVKSDFFKFDEIAKYMVGASFIKMIEEKYGINGIRILRKLGIEKGAIHLGTTVDNLGRELMNRIGKASEITDHDWRCLQNDCTDTLLNKTIHSPS